MSFLSTLQPYISSQNSLILWSFFQLSLLASYMERRQLSLSNINDGLKVSALGAMAQQLSEAKRIKGFSWEDNLSSTILPKQWVELQRESSHRQAHPPQHLAEAALKGCHDSNDLSCMFPCTICSSLSIQSSNTALEIIFLVAVWKYFFPAFLSPCYCGGV